MRILGNRAFVCGAMSVGQLLQNVSLHLNYMRAYDHSASANLILPLRQTLLNLQGQNDNPVLLTGNAMDEDVMLRVAEEQNVALLQTLVNYNRLQLAYLFDDFERADQIAHLLRNAGCHDNPGAWFIGRVYWFRALVALALAQRGRSVRKYVRQVNTIMKTFRMWQRNGNPNVLHQFKLIEAELAHLHGKESAGELYKEAIRLATRGGFLHDKGLAHEQAGKYYKEKQRDSYWAAHHFDCAVQAYHAWGAHALVEKLLRNHRGLLMEQNCRSSELTRSLLDLASNPELKPIEE